MLRFLVVCVLAALCAAQEERTSVLIQEPLQVDVAPAGVAALGASWSQSETIEFPAPNMAASVPSVHLPKGAREVVEIPHANIAMPGNAVQNKELLLNLPSPTIEAPNPIIRKKDVLFRLPQQIFYIPNPIVQHKPIVHRVPHTLRTITPRVNLQAFLFKVPSAQITGKSGYSA